MFRTIRALVIAVLVAASLLTSASVASADPGPRNAQPINVPFDITWE